LTVDEEAGHGNTSHLRVGFHRGFSARCVPDLATRKRVPQSLMCS
jgi:hypothetical protein